MRALFLVALLVHSGAARAASDDQAKQLYSAGKDAYERGKFDEALQDFQQAYQISQRPALLFNMARALEQLGRSHDAAEQLRGYLKLVPNDLERSEIESRIRALDEKQQKLDEAQRLTMMALQKPERRPRQEKIAGLALMAGGVALLVAGGACAGLAGAANDRYLHPANGVYSPGADDERSRYQVAEAVLLPIGGAAAVTGVVLYVLGFRQSHSLRVQVSPRWLALQGNF